MKEKVLRFYFYHDGDLKIPPLPDSKTKREVQSSLWCKYYKIIAFSVRCFCQVSNFGGRLELLGNCRLHSSAMLCKEIAKILSFWGYNIVSNREIGAWVLVLARTRIGFGVSSAQAQNSKSRSLFPYMSPKIVYCRGVAQIFSTLADRQKYFIIISSWIFRQSKANLQLSDCS